MSTHVACVNLAMSEQPV